MGLFKGLKYLEFHANDGPFGMKDDLEVRRSGTIGLKEFIECLVGITKNANLVVFRDFSFSGSVSWELMNYIRENNLPVKFVKGPYHY